MLRRRAMGFSAPPGFSPSDIAGLMWWAKADGALYQDSARTVVASVDGDPVGSWTDQSSGAKHAAQATAAKRPTLKTAIFGSLPAVRFDVTDDGLQTAAVDFSGTDKVTIFLVVKNVPTGVRVLVELGPTYSTVAGFLIYTDPILHTGLGIDGDVAHGHDINAKLAAPSILAARLDRGQLAILDEHQAYMDGVIGVESVTVNNAVTGNFVNDFLNIGSRNSGASFPSGTDFGEVVVYNSLLSNADVNRVGNYLERWGQTWADI